MISFKKFIATLTAITSLSTMSIINSNCIQASATTVGTNLTTSKVGDVITVGINLNSELSINSLGVEVHIGDGFEFVGDDAESTCAIDSSYDTIGDGVIAFSAMSYDGVNVSNNLVTFKIRTTSNLTASNNTITYNIDAASLTEDYTISGMSDAVMRTSYKKGDVNGDGGISSADSVCILHALNANMVSSVSVSYLNHGHLDDWFPNISTAETADANSDSYITSADSDTILSAYANIMAHTYTGNLGRTYSIIIK